MVLPLRPKKYVKGGVDAPNVRLTIWEKGVEIRWEKFAKCPCRRVMTLDGSVEDLSGHTGEHQSECEACKGTGSIYFDPQTIPAVVGQIETDPKLQQILGMVGEGSVMITVLPECAPGFRDRYTLLHSRTPFSETVVHDGPLVSLRYPVLVAEITGGSGADDTEVEVYEVGVLQVRRADAEGTIQPETYVEGVDFAIDDDGRVDWEGGSNAGAREPDDGDFVAYTYYVMPRYIVTRHPYTQVMMMTQWKLATAVHVEVMSANICQLEWASGAE